MSDIPKPRIGPDGHPQDDWKENPKALERKRREAAERERFLAEEAEPWSRRKIERLLAAALKRRETENEGVPPSSINMHGAILPDGIDLTGLDLSHANMHGVRARGARFSGSDLRLVNAHGAVFEDCVFDDAANMELVNLCQACLKGTSFHGVKAEYAGGGFGNEKWKGGLTRANLSESCCHGSVRGLDIQEHELTTRLVDDAGQPLMARIAPGETNVCQDCGQAFASTQARIEHTVREGHSSWSVKSDLKLGAREPSEPAVMDTRLWLAARGRIPVVRGGKLRSTGTQLWRANLTDLRKNHVDRLRQTTVISGTPEDFVL